ncbi:lipoprotein LpqV [Mycolicibacterium sediminis]|uniref:LpqV protein n=1 Tax=Mycolicibacterium sediminis TaxID=1286180 RepID=A0A7I7QYV4_9MYCO|nr:lipoprotein LpqV [Mycolicibacterium sediminis]BBY31445.1 LpqV protein [Mycolicibacterium sediminis]
MRTDPIATWTTAATLAVALLTGCSSGSEGTDAQPSGQSSTQASPSATPTTETHTADPGQVGVSAAGVTTAVGAAATSTEEEYSKACAAAKTWMQGKGGDLKAQFEPYLADLQSTDSATPGTFGLPWSQLPPDRQSAVIVAAEAAADDLCG